MTIKTTFSLLMGLFFTFVQCRGNENIAHVLKNPERYANKTIGLSGTVKEYGNISLGVAWRSFILDDGSGRIIIKTNRTVLPKVNTQISVKGEIEELTLIGVILNEQ